MQLIAVGLNQSSAPLAVRERVAFVPSQVPDALAQLLEEVEEGFILSTCNRTEIYAIVGHARSGSQVLTQFLSRWHSIPAESLSPSLYSFTHAAAARHLFRVASGLDSMVLGEDQIVAQLRNALAVAGGAGSLGPRLHRLGDGALSASKRVRTETALGSSATSVVSVALGAATSQLGTLADRSVVVLGAGHTAELVVRHCRSAAPSASITVLNRTPGRAKALAERHAVSAAGWGELLGLVADADLVVGATSAAEPVVRAADLREVLRAGRALVCLDLAVPRDIEPGVGALPNVVVYDMDYFQRCADAGRERREAEIAPAEAIVGECVAMFEEWWRGREVAPAISRLRARADAIRDAELERALRRLQLDSADEMVVRELAARVLNQFLHQPMTTLRSDPEAANLAAALDRLFTPGTP
ncbi:MAG TPA: glutamyl-tRNA reductase [Gemmatimonadales bacterium]|nr:glutamyl-tRNA reductase [Gemmatimonadales bacterium]